VLSSLGGMLISDGVRVFAVTADSVVVLAKQRYAMDRIVREVRQVNVASGQYDFSLMTATGMSFIKDDMEQVTFAFTGTDLTIAYASVPGTYVLEDNVNSVTFRYYEIDGVTQTVLASTVAFVEISLDVAHGNGSLSARTRVALRS